MKFTTNQTPSGGSADGRVTLWRNGDFVKFWAGQSVSLLGTQVSNLAFPLAAISVYGATAQQVGVLRFVELAPYLFLSLPFGVWVDRSRRRPVMMFANGSRMLLLAAIPILAHGGWMSVNGLVIAAAIAGILAVLFDVTWASYLPTLVRSRDKLVEANQKLGVTQSTTGLAGPGLAGLIIGWMGPISALLLDAVSYAFSFACLFFIRTPEMVPDSSKRDNSFLRELAEGVNFVFSNPMLRPLALIAPFTNLSLTCVSTLFLLTGVRDLGLTPGEIGLIFSVSAVGAVVGALASQTLINKFPTGPLYVVALAALYAAPILLPMAKGPGTAAITIVIVGLLLSYFGSGLSNVIQLSIRQNNTPTEMMGRMSAAFRTLLFGGGAIGGLVAGFLAGAIGDHAALWVVTVWSAAMVIPIALSPVRKLRRPTETL